MDTPTLVMLTQKALWLLALTAAPTVVIAGLVGLLIAVVQAATQLQDQSISQSAKLGAVLLVLWAAGGWMSREIMEFGNELMRAMSGLRA
jgi:type III secretion HrpO family protein